MSTLNRREGEKLQRRNDIVEAAEELFDKKGYAGTTIEEVARRTELSKGTIYLYFKSKDDLFLAVCANGITGFRAELEASVLPKRGLENKIKAMYLSYVDYFLKVPHIFRVLQDTYTERLRSNISSESIDTINWTIAEALFFGSLFVQQGIDTGLFRKDVDPYAFSVMSWRMATGLIELAALNEPGVADAASVKKMFSKSIELLVDGLKAKGAAPEAGRTSKKKPPAR
jgi:AcrR family transcriptional regulator